MGHLLVSRFCFILQKLCINPSPSLYPRWSIHHTLNLHRPKTPTVPRRNDAAKRPRWLSTSTALRQRFPKAQELMLLVGAHRQKLVIDFGEKALGNKGIFFSFLHLKKRQIVRRTQPAQLRSRKMLNISMHMWMWNYVQRVYRHMQIKVNKWL